MHSKRCWTLHVVSFAFSASIISRSASENPSLIDTPIYCLFDYMLTEAVTNESHVMMKSSVIQCSSNPCLTIFVIKFLLPLLLLQSPKNYHRFCI